VDEPTERRSGDQAEQPEHEQDHEDRPEQGEPLLASTVPTDRGLCATPDEERSSAVDHGVVGALGAAGAAGAAGAEGAAGAAGAAGETAGAVGAYGMNCCTCGPRRPKNPTTTTNRSKTTTTTTMASHGPLLLLGTSSSTCTYGIGVCTLRQARPAH